MRRRRTAFWLVVDWSEQAAKKAADYLDYSSFSRSGLIEQIWSSRASPQSRPSMERIRRACDELKFDLVDSAARGGNGSAAPPVDRGGEASPRTRWRAAAALSAQGVRETGDAVGEVGGCSAEAEYEPVDGVVALVVLPQTPEGEAVVLSAAWTMLGSSMSTGNATVRCRPAATPRMSGSVDGRAKRPEKVVAACPVDVAESPHVPIQVASRDEQGQHRLIELRDVTVAAALLGHRGAKCGR